MHNRGSQPTRARFMQKRTVQYCSRGWLESEGNVGQSKQNLTFWESFRNPLDALQRLEAQATIFVIASRNGECQRIKEQVVRI